MVSPNPGNPRGEGEGGSGQALDREHGPFFARREIMLEEHVEVEALPIVGMEIRELVGLRCARSVSDEEFLGPCTGQSQGNFFPRHGDDLSGARDVERLGDRDGDPLGRMGRGGKAEEDG